jgi:carboxypeptidase family protein/TonB-dependent receptor-like protein
MHNMCKMYCLASLIMIAFCGALAVSAQQSATANLSGRVIDPAGSVIVGARAVIEQSATGFRREITTNSEGIYVFTSLPAGEYVLTIKAANFPRSLKRIITLRVGQSATFDGTLEVGGPTEEAINISSDSATSVNTSSAVVEGVVTSRAVQTLPLNGRNFLELALLIPGNTLTPNYTPSKSNTVVISSAGQFGRTGNVMIDGADNNDDAAGGPLQNISQDAVHEFQIATSRFSAELGRTGSSVINVVTKSGANDLHGSTAIYWRDRRLQGLPATFDRNSGQEPPFDREQFSATLGGPIKKDRAWWFGSFEYRNQDGALLVGQRDTTTRTIKRAFAPAPVNDALGTGRIDWRPTNSDSFNLRYSIQREDDVAAASLQRAIGSATQRQAATNHFDSVLSNYTRVMSSTAVNSFSFGFNRFVDTINQVTPGPQLTFPSIQDGASWRVPQQTRQKRLQFVDALSLTRGAHAIKFGGEVHRIDAAYSLGVFRYGRIELVEDFASADRNNDGRIDDDDLLFRATLRKTTDQSILQPDVDNIHIAAFIQDDWRVTPRLTLSIGLRYQIDTDEKLISRYDEVNPIVLPFLKGKRERDKNNFAPRFGFNWATKDARTSVHGGYGIYYDKIILQITSLERALDGRNLAVAVRAGNAAQTATGRPIFLDQNGRFLPGAPTLAVPFTGPIVIGEGASGINIIDNAMQNPMVQQLNLGIQREVVPGLVARADYVHSLGTHFLIGRTIGSVFNPVVGGNDRVVNLESSAKTKYDGLLVSVEKRFSSHFQFRASYTLSKSFNYANDDQVPFSSGPVDPNNMQLEYGPPPNDQRHRLVFAGDYELPRGFGLAAIWTMASDAPMDIIMPDGNSRVPLLQRNAGGRVFHTGAELNAFFRQVNSTGGVNYRGAKQLLPLVRDDARFSDGFNSFDLRVSKAFKIREKVRLEPMAEAFNLFNVTNILGVSNVNYSGFANVLTRDSNNPNDPGFLRSSGFGAPITTAGGVFGSGGPRAFQFAVKLSF